MRAGKQRWLLFSLSSGKVCGFATVVWMMPNVFSVDRAMTERQPREENT